MMDEGWEWAVKKLQEETHCRAEINRIPMGVRINIYLPNGKLVFSGLLEEEEEHIVQFLIIGFMNGQMEID